MFGHSADLTLRAPAGNDHIICDAGFSGEINSDEIFRLVILEGCVDKLHQTLTEREVWFLLAGREGLTFSWYKRRPPLFMPSCPQPSDVPNYRWARICVAERVFNRLWRNTQAGGVWAVSRLARASASRKRANRRAALAAQTLEE